MFLEYQQYLQKFSSFLAENILVDQFVAKSVQANDFSAAVKLYKYKSAQQRPKRIVLIVPSILNSPEILFINKQKNFIELLQQNYCIYLMNWQQIKTPNYDLSDYISEIVKAVKYLQNHHNCRIDLLGHCIGGTMGLLAANLNIEPINSIAILNAPWDFSYLHIPRIIHQRLGIDKIINHLDYVPKIYQQIMFFLLNPQYFQKKVTKFLKFSVEENEQRKFFFEVERWLLSGQALPKAAYKQLTEQFIDQNILHKNAWLVDGQKISDLKINLPVCIVTSEKDSITPPSSTLPLLKIIKNSTLIEVKNGHISYLIGAELANFFKKFNVWFEACK